MAVDLISENRRGIAGMVASMMLFICNDALIKHVSESLPTGQIIFLRGLSATVLIAALALGLGAWRQMPAVIDRPVLLRAASIRWARFFICWRCSTCRSPMSRRSISPCR